MKNFKLLFPIFLLLVFLSGCRDENTVPYGEIKTTAAEIAALSESNWVLSRPSGTDNPFLFRLTWDKARFNYESGDYFYVADVKYILEADLMDNNFSKPIKITETEKLYADFYTKDLKTLIDQIIGSETKTPNDISFRIKTVSEYGEMYSQPFTLNITSYLDVEPTVENIFIIGDMNGWDNTSKEYIMFRANNDANDQTYTYTGYFPKASYFKFCSEKNLGSYLNMYCADTNGVLKLGDFGAFYVEQGYYTITIDIKNMNWNIVAFDGSAAKTYSSLGPIGGFCNWDNEPAMSQSAFDPHQWRISYTFNSSTACKFRANHDWGNNWGGTTNEIPYGKAVFDGSGATINDAGTYDIYFNDLTGHYVIKKQ